MIPRDEGTMRTGTTEEQELSSRKEAATGQSPRNKQGGRGEEAQQSLSNLLSALHWPGPVWIQQTREPEATDCRYQPTRHGVDRGKVEKKLGEGVGTASGEK